MSLIQDDKRYQHNIKMHFGRPDIVEESFRSDLGAFLQHSQTLWTSVFPITILFNV